MTIQTNSSNINETFIIEGQEGLSGDCSAIYTDLIESCTSPFIEIGSELLLSQSLTGNTFNFTDGYISNSLYTNELTTNNVFTSILSATTLYGDGSNLTGIDTSFTTKFISRTGDTMTGQLKAPSVSATTYYGSGANLTGIIHNNTVNRNALSAHTATAIGNDSTLDGNNVNEVFENASDFTLLTGNISDTTKFLGFTTDTVFITGKNILDYINSGNTFVNVTGGTMTGQLKAPSVSATTYYGSGANLTSIDHNTVTTNKQGGQSNQFYHLTQSEYSKVSGNTLNNTFVNVSGDTMTGTLTVSILSATTIYGNGVNITGLNHNTIITNLQGGGLGNFYHLSQLEYSKVSGNTLETTFVNVTGDTMTGQLKAPSFSGSTYYGSGTNLTGIVEQINGKFVHLSGDTMTGQLLAPSFSASTYYGDGANLTGIIHNNTVNRNSINSHPASAITNNSALDGSDVNEVFENASDFTLLTGTIGDATKFLGFTTDTVFITGKNILDYINSGNTFVNTSGDTMTGTLNVSTLSATTLYGDGSNLTGIVGQINGSFVHLSGDTMTGQLKSPNISATTITAVNYYGNGSHLTGINHNTVVTNLQGGQSNQFYHLTQLEYSKVSGNTLENTFVNVTGDTMTGTLKLPTLSATSITAVNYYGNGSGITGLDTLLSGTFVKKIGDTMSGALYAPVISATTYRGNAQYLNGILHNTVVEGLQGGQSNQFYHLTQSEYSKVSGNTLETTFVNATGDTMSGSLYAPVLSATTIYANRFYGDGSYITGLPELLSDVFVKTTGDIMTGGLKVPSITATTLNILDRILSSTGEVLVDDDLKITGNLIVLGDTVSVNTEQLLVEDNLITLNYGETGTTVTKGSAGIEIDRGTGDKYQFMFIESANTFNIGIQGDTQPVAVREITPINGGVAIWNFGETRFDTSNDISVDSISAGVYYGNGENITNIDHNTVVEGLQGGQNNQFYHLTQLEYSKVSGNTLNNTFVNTSGDTMTGQLKAPSVSATTYYGSGYYLTGLDTALASTFINTSGDTMIGQLNAPVFSGHTIIADKFYGDGSSLTGIGAGGSLSGDYVSILGATMTGNLTLPTLIAQNNIIIQSLSGTTDRILKVDKNGKLVVTGSTNEDVTIVSGITGTQLIDTITDANADGGIWDYVVKSGVNLRSGTITGVWLRSNSTCEFYEISTNDIGDTKGVTLSVNATASTPKLNIAVTGGTWTIKTSRRLL